ncbi:MAG: type 4a pilus biogenesis protein PilO [Planctomycetota bacterium]
MKPRELAMLGLVLAIPVAAYFTVFVPQNESIAKAKDEISHKRALMEDLQRETARNEDLAAANAEIERRVAEIEARLPSDKEVDAIVRQVTDLAVEAGLEPPSITSRKPIRAAMYMEQPLEMETAGDFPGLYSFLQRLERLPRITRMLELDVSQQKPGERGIDIKFTLSIFFQDEAAATVAGGGA